MAQPHFALGFGVGTKSNKGDWLEVFYPQPLLNPNAATIEAMRKVFAFAGGNVTHELANTELEKLEAALCAAGETAQAEIVASLQESTKPCVVTLLASDDSPKSV